MMSKPAAANLHRTLVGMEISERLLDLPVDVRIGYIVQRRLSSYAFFELLQYNPAGGERLITR